MNGTLPGRLIPYRLRRIHRFCAWAGGYFWLPCPLCGRPFGGHEWRDIGGNSASVPVTGKPGHGEGICPRCTRDGRGGRNPTHEEIAQAAWAALAADPDLEIRLAPEGEQP